MNQAVKALIIARNYMSDDSIDLCLVPSQLEMGPDCLSLEVLKHGKTPDTPAPEDDCFKAAGSTKPHALAGAVANAIRDGVAHLSVSSVGPMATLRAIKAVAVARTYVAETHTVRCVPFFVDVMIGEEERTGIRLDVFSAPL